MLPSLNSILELYRAGMSLVLNVRSYLRLVEMLKRLSLNAEIQAVHAGDTGLVFQTIARELRVVTTDAKVVLAQLMSAALQMSDNAISSAAHSRLCEKYQAARHLGLAGCTESAVAEQVERIGQQLLDSIAQIRSSLDAASAALGDVERLGVQLPMIATLLRIEAYRDVQVHEELAHNAQELLVLKGQLSQLLPVVQRQTATTMEMLALLGRS